MPGNRDMRVLARLFLFSSVMFLAPLPVAAQGVAQEHAKEQVQRQQEQPLNNAPVWRDVRSTATPPYQTTQVRGIETNVLVQTQGEIWRQILEIYSDQVYSVALISGVMQPVAVRTTLQNVPEEAVYNWEPGAQFGVYRPDTFWFENGRTD